MTTILVVDDAEDAADLLVLLFEACGHLAHVAYDGKEGLAEAKRFMPHIIFLDLDMPLLDGFSAAKAIRASPDTDHPFIVALTARSGADIEAQTNAAGFDLYLQKPADTNALLALVDDLAGRDHESASA